MSITPVIPAPVAAPGCPGAPTGGVAGGDPSDVFASLFGAPAGDVQGQATEGDTEADLDPDLKAGLGSALTAVLTGALGNSVLALSAAEVTDPVTAAGITAGTVKIPAEVDAEAEAAQVVDEPAEGDNVSAAQILTAAQVVPVAPMLAAAPTLNQVAAAKLARSGEGEGPVELVAPAAVRPGLVQRPAEAPTMSAASLAQLGSPAAPVAAPVAAPATVPVAGTSEVLNQAPVSATPAAPSAPAPPHASAGNDTAPRAPSAAAPAPVEDLSAPAPAAPSTDGASEGATVAAPQTDSGATGSGAGHTREGSTGQPSNQAGNQVGVQFTAPAHDKRLSTEPLKTDSAAATPTAPTAQVNQTVPTAAAAPVQALPTSTQTTNAVTGQVFPEITRLVTQGNGTNRITLKLAPEALGEVRVVLTVRQGEVSVRLAGSEMAQRALLQGTSELHRLLEAVGATSSQIHIGDQSSNNSGGQPSSQHGNQPETFGAHDGAPREGQHNTNHRTAGTRDGDTSARDGATRGSHPRPSTDPGTRTRLSGVDVTM